LKQKENINKNSILPPVQKISQLIAFTINLKVDNEFPQHLALDYSDEYLTVWHKNIHFISAKLV